LRTDMGGRDLSHLTKKRLYLMCRIWKMWKQGDEGDSRKRKSPMRLFGVANKKRDSESSHYAICAHARLQLTGFIYRHSKAGQSEAISNLSRPWAFVERVSLS
jgi:hypothetical protein